MNIRNLKIIEETLKEELLEKIIQKQPIINDLYLYDVTHLKNELISIEDEEEETLEEFILFKNNWPVEINYKEFYIQQFFNAKDKTAEILTTLEGSISEQVNLIINDDQIGGFIRYFITEIPAEYNIKEILEKYDSIEEVQNYFLEFNNKKQLLPVNRKLLANKYFRENNSKRIYLKNEIGVIKTIGLTKNFLEMINLK